MKIKELTLLTNELNKQKDFFTATLGFSLITQSDNHFSIQIGWTLLTFIKSLEAHTYHYCFLIPSNKLDEALNWMNQRRQTITLDDGGTIAHFESWNADSFYFYDAAGNVAECMVRYDLKNESNHSFELNDFLCVNEIGVGTSSIPLVHTQLKKILDIPLWKGDIERFGAHGSQEGLLLLADYNIKKTWFPTSIPIKASPFEAILQNSNVCYAVSYKNEAFICNEI